MKDWKSISNNLNNISENELIKQANAGNKEGVKIWRNS